MLHAIFSGICFGLAIGSKANTTQQPQKINELVTRSLFIPECDDLCLWREISNTTDLVPPFEEKNTNSFKCPRKPGWHDNSSPFYCSKEDELIAIQRSPFQKILKTFEKIFYEDNQFRSLIPKEELSAANKIANRILQNELLQYGCPLETLVDRSGESRAQALRVEEAYHVSSRGELCFDNDCMPEALIDLHELRHVQDCVIPALGSIMEIFTTLEQHIRTDLIYKEIRGISKDQEVNYNKFFQMKGKEFQAGSLANFYRNLQEKYGKFSTTLLSSESIEYITGIDHAFLSSFGLEDAKVNVSQEKLSIASSSFNEIESTEEPSLEKSENALIEFKSKNNNALDLIFNNLEIIRNIIETSGINLKSLIKLTDEEKIKTLLFNKISSEDVKFANQLVNESGLSFIDFINQYGVEFFNNLSVAELLIKESGLNFIDLSNKYGQLLKNLDYTHFLIENGVVFEILSSMLSSPFSTVSFFQANMHTTVKYLLNHGMNPRLLPSIEISIWDIKQHIKAIEYLIENQKVNIETLISSITFDRRTEILFHIDKVKYLMEECNVSLERLLNVQRKALGPLFKNAQINGFEMILENFQKLETTT